MVLLSGEVYTARDVAHRRLYDALTKGEVLPIDLPKAIYFTQLRRRRRPARLLVPSVPQPATGWISSLRN